MVAFNEFFNVFNEFGLTNIVFLIKNNPHPNDNTSRDYSEGIDLSQMQKEDNEYLTIDSAILSSGDVLTYNGIQNTKDEDNEYLSRYDIQIITQYYDNNLSNGECLMLLYSKINKCFELYQIVRQLVQPSLSSNPYLWGVYKKKMSKEEITSIEDKFKVDIINYLSYSY